MGIANAQMHSMVRGDTPPHFLVCRGQMGRAMENEKGGRSGSRSAKNAGWATAGPYPI